MSAHQIGTARFVRISDRPGDYQVLDCNGELLGEVGRSAGFWYWRVPDGTWRGPERTRREAARGIILGLPLRRQEQARLP